MDVSTKRTISQIKKDLQESLQTFAFEPDDDITRSQVNQVVGNYLREIKQHRSIHDYAVVCDDSNNQPYDPELSLLQGLSEEILEDYLIESDENNYYLYYRNDILYRSLDKQTGKITTYFENLEVPLMDSQSLNVDIYLKPQKSVKSVVLNIKLGCR